ncbi:GDSL-type esterase/lipase family protein [Phenylobacterium sp.]|uniref:GDSL-type esterase/lipase family protein n=1 Tax=Phenylobacterium sp. TaxID=1871053 RepID=UPI0025E686BD|nr:GDSL-type esterase/lipase family protein [Phenylobacterium sp.]
MRLETLSMRICFFGDSFVNGTGDDDCLGWVGRLCAAERRAGADLTMYNLGIRRDTSEDILRRWKPEAAVRLPVDSDGRLVFSFGLNDLAPDDEFGRPRISEGASLQNAHDILSEASAWRPTLMMGPLPVTSSQPRNDQIRSYSEHLNGLCASLGVPFFDAVPFAAEVYETWRREADAGDGIHPNAESYSAFASAIHAWWPWR